MQPIDSKELHGPNVTAFSFGQKQKQNTNTMKNIILLAIVAIGALSMTACKTTKSCCGTCAPAAACSK
ncbi:MAG: hypothetical protein NWS30_00725 [Verrucomicrobiales bacterium]|nr:hypothetical protein [Verrucomicrobiales bacterium]